MVSCHPFSLFCGNWPGIFLCGARFCHENKDDPAGAVATTRRLSSLPLSQRPRKVHQPRPARLLRRWPDLAQGAGCAAARLRRSPRIRPLRRERRRALRRRRGAGHAAGERPRSRLAKAAVTSAKTTSVAFCKRPAFALPLITCSASMLRNLRFTCSNAVLWRSGSESLGVHLETMFRIDPLLFVMTPSRD